jgi:hypothetical protein
MASYRTWTADLTVCEVHGPVADLSARCPDCDRCLRKVEFVPAEQLRAAVEEHHAFVEALTQALNAHGVPAMPSWPEAIDWLAANGGRSEGCAEDREEGYHGGYAEDPLGGAW